MKDSTSVFRPQTLAACLVGIAIGLAGGWFGRGAVAPELAKEEIARTRDNSRPNRSANSGNTTGRNAASTRSSQSPDSTPELETKELATQARTIFRDPDRDRRVARFGKMVERTRTEDFEKIVALVRENDLRGADTGPEWTVLWENWGQRNPVDGIEFIRSFNWDGWDRNAISEASSQTVRAWSRSDPDAASHFVDSSPEVANGDRSFVWGLTSGWAESDPEAAARWLFKSGLAMADEYRAVNEAIGQRDGFDGVKKWFDSISSEEIPEKDLAGFGRQIAESMREYEPEKSAAWVEEKIDEPWMQSTGIVESTARSWAERDPVAAIAWGVKIQNQGAMLNAVAQWCHQDRTAAAEWLDGNPDSPAYKQGAAILANMLEQSDAEAAKMWREKAQAQ